MGDERPCSPAMLLLLGGHVCQESHHGIRSQLSKVSCREWQQGTGERQGLQYVHRISDPSFCRVPQLMPSSKLGALLSTSNPCSTQGFGPPVGVFPTSHHLQTTSSVLRGPEAADPFATHPHPNLLTERWPRL